MRFWRLLFGRRGTGERAGIAPAPERAALAVAGTHLSTRSGPALDVSAPAARTPLKEPASAPEGRPVEATQPDRPSSAEDLAAGHETPADEVKADLETVGPEPEISPVRLDAALQRLRDENPAPSGETPSNPSA